MKSVSPLRGDRRARSARVQGICRTLLAACARSHLAAALSVAGLDEGERVQAAASEANRRRSACATSAGPVRVWRARTRRARERRAGLENEAGPEVASKSSVNDALACTFAEDKSLAVSEGANAASQNKQSRFRGLCHPSLFLLHPPLRRPSNRAKTLDKRSVGGRHTQ